MKALFLTLIVLSIPRLAIACSFAGSPAVCGSFAAAEAVLVGTVSRVETKTTKTDDSDEFIYEQTAYVQVEESFKGVKESQMIFRSNRSSCEPTYQEGQRWLFYAYSTSRRRPGRSILAIAVHGSKGRTMIYPTCATSLPRHKSHASPVCSAMVQTNR